jgi:hypothetical protein
MLPAPWTEWWQDDLPCVFDQETTFANLRYLVNLFGESWLEKHTNKLHENLHPLAVRWLTCGLSAYIELNVLASDLRLLESKPNFELVLADLLDASQYLPAWHTLHSAALFERAIQGSVQEFAYDSRQKHPDFIVTIEGQSTAVEAKFVSDSQKEVLFRNWASEVIKLLMDTFEENEESLIRVIIVAKNIDDLPSANVILDTIVGLPLSAQKAWHKYQSNKFNLFCIPNEESIEKSFTKFRDFNCICPKSSYEDIRVLRRAKDASQQLKLHSLRNHPGLLCLGLGHLQNAFHIAHLINEQFVSGRLSSISNVLLSKIGTQAGPPKRTSLDMFDFINNPKARVFYGGPFRIRPAGSFGSLLDQFSPEDPIAVYRYGVTAGTYTGISGNISLLNTLTVSQEMLK